MLTRLRRRAWSLVAMLLTSLLMLSGSTGTAARAGGERG